MKSWLLAFPHLLIIALLTGTAQTWVYRDGVWVQVGTGLSLFGLLVFIAGVILLFTGVYSRGLFDFLMGLNRWIYRVAAYVSLMRDEYPPFHLDMGPRDPGDTRCASAGGASGRPRVCASSRPAPAPQPPPLRPIRSGRNRTGHGRAGGRPAGLLRDRRTRSFWSGQAAKPPPARRALRVPSPHGVTLPAAPRPGSSQSRPAASLRLLRAAPIAPRPAAQLCTVPCQRLLQKRSACICIQTAPCAGSRGVSKNRPPGGPLKEM